MHYLKKKQFWGFKGKKAHPANDFVFPLLRLEAHFQTGCIRQSFTYLRGDFWASFYCCPVWDFPGSLCNPRSYTNLGAHLSQGSEMQRTQSWWERLACNPLREVIWRLKEQGSGVAWEIRVKAQPYGWNHAASCWQVPPQLAPCRTEPGRFPSL